MLDERRKVQLGDASDLVQQECERLGLFETRTPRFSQLFFYNFDDDEVATRAGQLLTIKASQRGAKACLRSGARLESKCGISDVWYSYLLQNKALFAHPDSPPPTQEPATTGPRAYSEFHHLPHIYDTFRWKEEHAALRSLEQDERSEAVDGLEEGQHRIEELPSSHPFDRDLDDWSEEADGLVDVEINGPGPSFIPESGNPCINPAVLQNGEAVAEWEWVGSSDVEEEFNRPVADRE